MKTIQNPKTPEGLDRDPLTLLKEPLYVSVYRTRPGVRERVPLPNDGQRWSLEQVRAIEPIIEQVAGGGHYEIEVRDDRGMHKWVYDSSSPPKALGPEVPPMAGPQPYNPFGAFQQPAGPQAVPATAQSVDVPGVGKVVTVPGMPPFISTGGGNANGKEREDIIGASTPWRNPFSQWQSPWGGGWAPPWTQRTNDDGEAERTRRENERLKAEMERERQEARHREEMAELKMSIQRLAEQPKQLGPSPELVEMRAQQARLEVELKAERDRSQQEQRFAEMQRQHESSINALKDELRHLVDRPKEDPMRPVLELLKTQSETARYQSEASERASRITAEAQKEAARDQREMMSTLFQSLKSDSQTILPTIMGIVTQSVQLQSASMSTMMEAVREFAELKGKDDAPWWGKMIEGALGPLPEVAMQLTRAYAAGQQAKAAAAMGGASPAQSVGELPPGRRPRADGATAVIEGAPSQPQLAQGEPQRAIPAPGDAIARALLGYQSDVPGAQDSYDVQSWGTMLGEIQQLRKRIADGKMTPKDAAGALLNMVINKKQLEITIPAIESNFDNDHEKLARLVGLALGQAPTGIDPQEYLKYKGEVLKVFVAGLREIEARIRAEVAAEGGESDSNDDADDADDGNDAEKPTAPPPSEAKVAATPVAPEPPAQQA